MCVCAHECTFVHSWCSVRRAPYNVLLFLSAFYLTVHYTVKCSENRPVFKGKNMLKLKLRIYKSSEKKNILKSS